MPKRAGNADGSAGRWIEGSTHVLDEPPLAQQAECGAWVVAARGAYDMDSIEPLADALATAARRHRKVVLDASGITFADSTLVNLLILTHQSTDLRVAAPAHQLQRILQLTGLDTVLKIGMTVEDAVAC
ncbi:STAS domain-containing protein [Streptomyces phaeoluteigriseus]|uniref:STAS domain-containing protein n=1 Tax=Streptomyces phaeoluteigriseus TaxID=114686 RepID=UPI00369847BC